MDTITPTMTANDDRDAFSALLQRHAGIVFKIAGSYAHGPEDRADLAQDIAAQLWHAWPKYDPARSVTTWMYRIALNVAISHLRHRQLRQRHDALPLDEILHDVADGNAVDPENEQGVRLLRDFIARQPPLDRALLLLYLEDRSQREIAEILGITESNVSTKIGRMKQRIRDAFR
ncbi:sigma-70 family RNA polymerase sigma factor [Luteibacter sp. PPL201]|uniref:Sigma-70 family RNA polymerase sigma factor n=1 Tax=Luteibacter sahnii TaxID=3021977 RepID=A0ABT6BGZ2_9GAMM